MNYRLPSFRRLRRSAMMTGLAAVMLMSVSTPLMSHAKAQAASTTWTHQGANIRPRNANDFASEQMRTSLMDLRSTGANEAVLVIPFYQADETACTFYAGGDTPSAASVAAATAMAHAKGMKSILKFHPELASGTWRAMINASDRQCWYDNYKNQLLSYLNTSGADGAVIATEMRNMFSPAANATNASNVTNLVNSLRASFKGTLTYDAQQAGDQADLKEINWNLFDYGGLSCYWPLASDRAASWKSITTTILDPVHARYPKIGFTCTEVGYRSVTAARNAPWDYRVMGAVDQKEQATDYQALFDFMRTRSYITGVDFWDWRVDFNATDVDPTEFTPQKKLAQQVMTANFSGQYVSSPINAYGDKLKAVLGAPTSSEIFVPGGRYRVYQNGIVYWSPTTGVHEVRGEILTKYLALGGPTVYGFPTSGEIKTLAPGGLRTVFAGNKMIYWSPQGGAHSLYGDVLTKYLAAGGSRYGFPIMDESATADRNGRYIHFTGGKSIFWSPQTHAHLIYSDIRVRWASMGSERSFLGYPTSDVHDAPAGRQSDFQNGHSIYWKAATRTTTVR